MFFDALIGESAMPLTVALACGGGGALAASLVWWPIARRRRRLAWQAGLVRGGEAHQGAIELVNTRLEVALDANTRLEGSVSSLEAQLDASRTQLTERADELARARAAHAAAEARFEQAAVAAREKEALLRETGAALKREFERLADRVFDRQGAAAQTRLGEVLTPLREQLGDFRRRVDEVYRVETAERASLLTEVRHLRNASDRINREAANLASALKGDRKLQGNWGEMVLERVLEESGLRRDHEYFTQAHRRDAAGRSRRPDVLVRLPDDKDVVIDAKVSLNAYEQALTTADEAERERLLGQHVLLLRNHVKRLASQEYDKLQDVRSLDFVLLFVPIESAFTLAMELDQRLFTDAFERRIVLVSPTTLMMTLRIINTVWRYEKTHRNAQDIARRAGALYDKLRGFVEDMDTLGKQMATAEKTWTSAFGKLVSGRGNVVRQAEQLRELGAQARRPMSRTLVERSASDV